MSRRGNPTPLTDEQSRLAGENYRLAFVAVGKFLARDEGLRNSDELLSSAFYGLTMAARGFEPGRGVKFSTYAMQSMFSVMHRDFHSGRVIYIPAHHFQNRSRPVAHLAGTREAAALAHSGVIGLHEMPGEIAELAAPDEVEVDGDGEEQERTRRAAELREAIGLLPDRLRATVELRLADVPNGEIADRLGIRPDTVRSRIAEARQQLRSLLDPPGRGLRWA